MIIVLGRLLGWWLERRTAHTHAHLHHARRKGRIEGAWIGSLLLELPAETLLTLLHGVVKERHLRHTHALTLLTLPAVPHAHHRLLLLLLLLLHLHHWVDVTVMRLRWLHRCRHGLGDPSSLQAHGRLTCRTSDR